jgi:hypothetical protein
VRISLSILIILFACLPFAIAQEQEEAIVFGRSYQDLKPEQTRLIDGWFERFSEVMGRQVDPAREYNRVPVSYRTTFEAVTHALMTTDVVSAGAEKTTAIELIAQLDAVHGKIAGAGGDRQFRIYVTLKPDALDLLKNSEHFSRGMDNTVFHKGFPINYRQSGGVPSIQFSVARDGARADIDVDYRSSKIPNALFNGHLTASNSDVRAGNNYDRHVNRWQGLDNWWRSLFGLPLKQIDKLPPADDEFDISAQPAKKLPKIEDAVFDFLNTWFVEKNPARAIGYVTERCYDCVELEQGREIDRGMARYMILRGMMEAVDSLGDVSSLADVAIGVRLTNPALRVVEQPHHAQFVLFDVPDDVAARFECANRLRPEEAPKKAIRRYGNYYGAVMTVKAADGRSQTLATLWQKQRGYWRLITFEPEPDGTSDEVTDKMRYSPEAASSVELERVDGPPDFVKANRKFLEQWVVSQKYDQAIEYFDPQCYPCYNLFLKDGQEAIDSDAGLKAALRTALASVGTTIGKIGRLEDAIQAVDAEHPHVKLLNHRQDRAFVLGSVPSYMAEGAACARKLEGKEFPEDLQADPQYGDYYATGFRLREMFGSPGALYLVWQKKADGWKIVTYAILTP